jgi:hypothetical protein
LPFEIREAVVQVCGKAFWLKDPLRSFLLSAGVPPDLYDRFADESKYKIARHVLSELDAMGEGGSDIQRRVVTELCRLRDVPDPNVPDRDAALSALRRLKEIALSQKLYAEAEKGAEDERAREARRRQEALHARAAGMRELLSRFQAMVSAGDDAQRRGYGLEELLAELFESHEIPYRRPYRTPTEQIDGHFEYKGFGYLVEARWRAGLPSEADLAAFKLKVDKKLESTRGLFVSIQRPRDEVILAFTAGVSSNVVLMDGEDLVLILEGHVSLVDALDLKIQKATQEGIIHFPLRRRFEST